MMASNEETPEAKAFREHYATLAKAIQNPDTLVNELFAKGILSREVLEELQTSSLSTPKKNGRIVQCVYNYLVFIDPSKLQVFIDILRQESYSSQLSEKLIASYDFYQTESQRTGKRERRDDHLQTQGTAL